MRICQKQARIKPADVKIKSGGFGSVYIKKLRRFNSYS